MVSPKMLFQQQNESFDANQILVEHVHAITFKLQCTTYEPNFQQIEGKCNSKAMPIVKAHNLCDVLESSADEKLRLVAHPNCVPNPKP
jgi:hypothetical protein